jgi:SAM-dependent methyltransferase
MINLTPAAAADEFAEKLFGAVLGALDTWAVFVGDRLGLYEILADHGPMSEAELSTRASMHRRYAREWLEHQVTAGILEVDVASLPPQARRYRLPPAQREVLTDKDSLAYLAPFVRLVVAGGSQMPRLMDAYRNGGGVSWSEFGTDMRTGQAEMNRPWFIQELGSKWLPSVPQIHDRLLNGARVADVGCGEGWSTIAMAQAYANVSIDGFDIDMASIHAARSHALAAGVSERVRFEQTNVGTLDVESHYDLVTAFECIHDLPDPISVLSSMRRMSKDDGHVLIMDEAVGEQFGERTDEVERLMYGFSLFVCLPDGMSHDSSIATGTVMRPSVLWDYALRAGFSEVEVLPIETELWRFYQLKK